MVLGLHDQEQTAHNLQTHEAAIRPVFAGVVNMWRKFMFTDESKLCLHTLGGRVKVWRSGGERCADCCTDQVTAFD